MTEKPSGTAANGCAITIRAITIKNDVTLFVQFA